MKDYNNIGVGLVVSNGCTLSHLSSIEVPLSYFILEYVERLLSELTLAIIFLMLFSQNAREERPHMHVHFADAHVTANLLISYHVTCK